jgi:hypothetical protein
MLILRGRRVVDTADDEDPDDAVDDDRTSDPSVMAIEEIAGAVPSKSTFASPCSGRRRRSRDFSRC